MTSTSLPVDAVLIALVAIVVQVAKPLLELWLPPFTPAHDPVIRLVAVLLGIGFMLLERGVPVDGPGWVTVLGYGFGTALAAIGTYHLLTGSANPPPLPVDRARAPQDAANGGVGL